MLLSISVPDCSWVYDHYDPSTPVMVLSLAWVTNTSWEHIAVVDAGVSVDNVSEDVEAIVDLMAEWILVARVMPNHHLHISD